MYGINAKLPREYFKCHMCHNSGIQDIYIWGNFAIPPKHSYKEFKICKKCAIREHGKRTKLENIINERTKKWLKQKQKS